MKWKEKKNLEGLIAADKFCWLVCLLSPKKRKKGSGVELDRNEE